MRPVVGMMVLLCLLLLLIILYLAVDLRVAHPEGTAVAVKETIEWENIENNKTKLKF